MKKLITAVLLLLSIHSFSQESSTYNVFKTQLFKSTPFVKTWTPVSDPSSVDFKIIVEGSHLIIDAKSMSSFTIYNSSQEDVKGEGYTGKRFRALEHVKNQSCYISFINYTGLNFISVDVAYLNGDTQYLLVYYILKN